MASVKTYLDNILSAIYGKDVRQSIHDAIQQCYIDATTGITPEIEIEQISGGHKVDITIGSDVKSFNIMDGTAVISPLLLSDTKTTSPATQSEYTNLSVPDLVNYNVVSVRCSVGNIVQVLTFYRQMGDVPQYIIDNDNLYIRGGFLVDWTNNLIGVRWVNGMSSSTPALVYFDKVVAVG